MPKRFKRASLTAIFFVLAMAPAYAGLIGDSVQVDYIFGATKDTVFSALGTNTVTALGTAFNSFGQHNFTFFDATITLSNVFGSPVTFTTNQ